MVPTPAFVREFGPAATGPDVEAVKRALVAAGHGQGENPWTETFGAAAVADLKAFQTMCKLTPDGVYGPSTHRFLAPYFDAFGQSLLEKEAAKLKQAPFAMFDSVDGAAVIPTDAAAVAGYVGGQWPNYQALVHAFPHAKHLSVAVNASEDADCLDVESGDATAAQAPAWIARQVKRGVKLPVVYTSVSNVAALLSAGVKRDGIRLWTAHYTNTAHICSPACGNGMTTTADATQWTDNALGRNLDESLCNGSFLT